MKLRPEIKPLIKSNNIVIGSLMVQFDKCNLTIMHWVDKDNAKLSTPEAIQIMKDGLEKYEHEIFIKEHYSFSKF